MSSVAEASDVVGANCGIAEVDDIQLEDWYRCDLVKYCGDKCKGGHREQDEEECKNRKAELHDIDLFTHPDGNHLGECPLCFLPMSLDAKKSTFYSCCGKIICSGCVYAHHVKNGGDSCSFCREPAVNMYNREKRRKMMTKRVKANDPAALSQMGIMKRHKECNYDGAFEYLKKAAESGDAEAHYQLGCMYGLGQGVDEDAEKEVYHLEKAAIGGHPTARHNLGCREHENGNIERAAKHLIIAANLGYEKSMKSLWEYYSDGNITKEDLDATLRTHHAAINEMKSPEREAAEQAWS
jgi:hypothetical protein